ncbi:hypothetical protein [Antarcticimicrobium luteum]|uniref:ATP synthase subunit b n=1 Tax=Antarcticimicrobium luteum TaxID=2547397 RepID=A0A4R5VAS9_9RHOB|nr:hypothetical protein [Antarcticimicrobium luteum]TDK48735.1 hypothetical protein E1832_09800 [Antarcticimicrobium luteum]
MQIDWLTVAAQIVNFLALVLLLRWALYRPLARALAARAEAVRQRLDEAEAARAGAEAAAIAHTEAVLALEQSREVRLERAEQEAEAKRAELVEAAKAELAARRAAWQAQLEDERAAFLDRLRLRAGAGFVRMARNILAEMADQDLVDRMAQTFAGRLAGLEAADRARLRAAADAGKRPEILSSLPLSDAARRKVAAAVGGLLGGPAEPVFAEDADLSCGLVLRLGSQRVGWTIAEHLDRFAQDVEQLLDASGGKGDG